MALMSKSRFNSKLVKMLVFSSSIFFLLGPTHVSAQNQLPPRSSDLDKGIKLVEQEQGSQGVNLLKNAIKVNKADAEAWYYLGVAYVQMRDFKKAESTLKTAISLNPKFGKAHTALSYALMRRRKLAEARKEAEVALTLEPKSADAHYTLGVIDFRSGKTGSAILHANAAIEQKPNFAQAHLLKSQALVSFFAGALVLDDEERKEQRIARYSEAAAALEKYLQLVPDSEDKDIWKHQLESLQFYSKTHDTVYSGRQVTTRVRLISKPEPTYTNDAKEQGIVGTIVLRAVFAADGQVKHILITQGLLGGLTEQAVRAAYKIRFIPATLDGKPVSMWIQLEYNFNLY